MYMSCLLCKCPVYYVNGDANLELVDKFCYLGDMLSVDGDADAAVETRIQNTPSPLIDNI